MDKILEFINNKTNNKYKNLLFFDAVYDSKTSAMQITFKKPAEVVLSPENTSEIEVLCKLFLSDLIQRVNVVFKSDNYTLFQFKDFVKQTILNCDKLSGVDVNNINFNFDKTSAMIDIPIFTNIDNEKLNFAKLDIEKTILDNTSKNVEVRFITANTNNTDVLELRKERILEDNKIYEQIQQSQIVNFEVLEEIYNNVSNTTGLIAGSDIGVGNVIVVGKIKTIVEKTRKSQNEDLMANSQNKYLVIELENDGLITRSVLFLKKDEKELGLKIDDSVAIEGLVNEFNGTKSVIIKNIVLCKYDVPKQVWRSKPSTYRFVKPEPYQFFEQSNFFLVEEDTKCEYLKNNTFVVYDLETTGINPQTNDIIDIGAFKIINGKITEKFATFVNPMREIPEEASKINHITNSMVENSPTIEQVLPDFYNFCYGSTIVGYNNIGFDDLFIKKEGKKQLYNFDNNRDDVMQLAKTYLKGLKNYKLGTVCNELGVQLIDAHRATNDALATAKIFIKIAEKFM